MNTALTSSAGAVLSAYNDAFTEFASTIEYPVYDIKISPTAKPFTFSMNWKCPEVVGNFTSEDVKYDLKVFSIDLFKVFGYIVMVNEPEIVG